MTDSNLKIRIEKEIYPVLTKELKIDNPMSLPRIKKIVLNIGIPKTDSSKKDIVESREELTLITGQLARINKAKQSIAGFKLREGDAIGVSTTLRGQSMFDFLDKLCRIVLPQVKVFRGVKTTSFDGAGNYTLGLSEQIIFPEIDYSKVQKIRGLEITIVTSGCTDEIAYRFLELIGIPFEKKDPNELGDEGK